MWHPFTRSTRTALGLLAFVASASIAQANNVQVALEGSLLTVFGDNVSNSVRISQSATEVSIAGNAGTLINGMSAVSFPGAVLNAVEVRMEGGNDSIDICNLQIANDLYINLGDGSDRVTTSGTNSIGANFSLEAGAGDDNISLAGLVVTEDTFIDGGLGILRANISDMNLGKGLTVLSDEAADWVSISNTWISDSLAIESKGGNDTITVDNGMSFAAFVNSDSGADLVTVSNWMTVEDIGIFTGTQNDTVVLNAVFAGKSMTVSVDSGNDSVTATSVTVTEDAVFEGGAGKDTITDRGITGGIKKDIKEFEVLLN